MAELTNAIQKFFIENSRLGIPVIFDEEYLHGHAAREGTSFPQPIGLGATFNPALVKELFTMTAHEARVQRLNKAQAMRISCVLFINVGVEQQESIGSTEISDSP